MIGNTLSHYKLGSELGRGGMGVVYRAKDSTLDRTVAIKFLASELTSNAVARERFIREAKAAAAIEHPSICSVHEIGETEEGETYIVMPYYEGVTLKELIAGGKQTPSKALDIGKQVASGLVAAHDKGVVHRDMKPGNVMLTTRSRAIILDFGLAKLGGRSDLTRSRSSVGTLPYMAPEQLRGEKVDRRTDIWGLGTVLYELVSGERPFQGDYEAAVSYSILNVDPPRLDSICDDLPEGFCDIIGRCLAKNPEDRYQTAEELLVDLEAPGSASVLPVAVATPAPVATAKTTPLVSRFIFRTVLVGIAVAALGIAYLQFSGIEEERIAILPFQVVGDDAGLETLSKGLRQVILDRLSELQYEQDALLMVPLTSFDAPESVPDARRSYGASQVISTVVERSGPVIQLSFSLLNAEDEIELASDQLVYTGTDQTSLQQASLLRITSLLGLDTDEYSSSDSLAGVTASFAYLSGVGYLTAPNSLGDVNRGIEQLLIAREDRRLASRADVGLGHAYLKKFGLTGDRELLGEAGSHFESALRSDAKLFQASFGMISIYKKNENKAAAIQEFEKAREAAPGNFEVLRKYAQFHSTAHDTELADSLFSLLVTAAPNVWIVYNSFGNHYLRTDRLNKAIDVLTIGLELAPENPTLLNTLAVSQYRTGDLHATLEILAPVAVANRANNVALKNLGVAYFYLGMYPNAVTTFEDYLDIDSTNYEVIGFLADAYFWNDGQRGKANEVYERAIGEAERRLSFHGLDTQTLESLTWYFANIGQVDSAMAFLNQTLDVYSKREGEVSGEDALGLAEVYVVLEDIDRSKYWIEKAAGNNIDWTKFDHSPWLEEIRSDSSFMEKISSYRPNN